MDFKNTLRKEINNNLSLLTSTQVNEKSNQICQKLFKTKEWIESESVFLYIPFGKEINTNFIIDKGISLYKKIYSPRINGKNMDFFRIDNTLDSLITNSMGIKEPPLGLEPKTPDSKTLIIVPGLAFSPRGERLGRGGGYYDRYLSIYKNAMLIALAFKCQITTKIPTDDWDINIKKVITED